VVTTLILGLVVWIAGVVVAARFGHVVDLISSLALIAFGLWVGITSLLEIHHERSHHHEHEADHDIHAHSHGSKKTRTALLLILGSSPMIEGIPAFFAAGKFGAGVIAVMAVVFAISTIATYVLLCTASYASIENLKLGKFEKYGEVLSGVFIASLGLIFLIFPVL
jgi:ABC-type nickel/cobalt efflux system permease component RcnA